jgi:hypothetical protein
MHMQLISTVANGKNTMTGIANSIQFNVHYMNLII